MNERATGFPDFKNLWLSVPQGELRTKDINWLGEEFDPAQTKEFRPKLTLSLESTGDDVANQPEQFKLGSEIFRLENDKGEVVALSVSKYYAWDRIKNSYSNYRLHHDEKGKISGLSISKFEDLVKTDEFPDFSMAVELAYNKVDPLYRGQGLGNKMFILRIARANSIPTAKPKLIWTMSRGAHLVEKTGDKIFNYLLANEERINGKSSDGRTVITGTEVPISKIKTDLNLPKDFQFDEVYKTSQPIVRLAEKAGMKKVGLFKDLSPIFVLTQK